MIQWALNRLFNRVDILTNGEPGSPIYLRRWFIHPRKPKDLNMVPRIYLHRFYTGDNVRDLHDHPWNFSSIILKGGYWEHSFNPEWLRWRAWQENMDSHVIRELSDRKNEPEKTVRKWYGPGSFLRRGAAWTHAVELAKDENGNDKPCWTLIQTGIKCRSWGFHTDNGWCWWRYYHSGACVCYDNPNTEELEALKKVKQ